MPVEVGIWRLGDTVSRVEFEPLESERKLEDTLVADLSILSPGLLLISRQVATVYGKFIDLLAMDADGNLVVIELKRDRTPREVVAQALDYASWVQDLSYDDITDLYSGFHEGKKFEIGFDEMFGGSPPEKLNVSHQMIIVASELDPSTERIINYLSDNYGVPVNAVFFRYFKDGASEYLTRSWLVDPTEVAANASKSVNTKSETWNGRDFYVSLGEGPGRNWDDCRRYGFISGGGGRWYSQTLNALFAGARVFVNIPRTGFVGVGEVVEAVKPAKEFLVEVDGQRIPIFDAPNLVATGMRDYADDPDMSEYLVRVKWLKTKAREEAYWEKGLFAVQHTACKLRNRFTIEKLTQHFGLDD